MKEETLKIITADDGKIFKRMSDGELLGEKISFDTRFDASDNYVEVDKSVEEERAS